MSSQKPKINPYGPTTSESSPRSRAVSKIDPTIPGASSNSVMSAVWDSLLGVAVTVIYLDLFSSILRRVAWLFSRPSFDFFVVRGAVGLFAFTMPALLAALLSTKLMRTPKRWVRLFYLGSALLLALLHADPDQLADGRLTLDLWDGLFALLVLSVLFLPAMVYGCGWFTGIALAVRAVRSTGRRSSDEG